MVGGVFWADACAVGVMLFSFTTDSSSSTEEEKMPWNGEGIIALYSTKSVNRKQKCDVAQGGFL
jgi:hypothetical protein